MSSSSFDPKPADRVPHHKASVWTEFSDLACRYDAVNLGQGFPDAPAPSFITDILKDISKKPWMTDAHQYTRGYGHPELVSVLGKMYSHLYDVPVDPNSDVLVTVGAYHALYYSFLGWINPEDEVLIIEPAFDCYNSQVKFAGGIPVSVVMDVPVDASSARQFTLNYEDLEAKINEKTKMLVINNPHNPTGKLFTRKELDKLAALAVKYNLMVIADEVYEFHVYHKDEMIRFASLPGMYNRTISIGSAGKAFSVTGWKLGWAIGPKKLLAPLKAIHQNCVFTCSTPTQLAVAAAFNYDWPKFLEKPKSSYLATGLSGELCKKGNMLSHMLNKAGFKPILPEAGYFMLANFSNFKNRIHLHANDDPTDFVFARWLCREKRLAVIPFSVFFSEEEEKLKNCDLVRMCFFKKEHTLNAAKRIMKKLNGGE